MSDNARYRSLDGGGPFVLEEHDPPGPCAHGVCVETRLDAATDELTLLLRHAERHHGGPTHACGDRVTVALSLATGQCIARGPLAESFLDERPWLAAALLRRLAWLRERARREAAQRDRRSSCFAALDRAEPGIMIPYDRLFPADWDLVFQRDGHAFWAIDLHCSNSTCTCTDVVVELRDIENLDAPVVGKIQVDMNDERPRPIASSPAAANLFKTLWTKHGAELVRRYHEVRRTVAQYAARRTAAAAVVQRAPTPSRNGPCPCGSGTKFKRCCAARDVESVAGVVPSDIRVGR